MNVTKMILDATLEQRATLGLCALLGIAVFCTLIISFQGWHSDWVLAHKPITATASINTTDETARVIAALPDAHLFGKSVSGDVPITNLQLRVTGIVKVDSLRSTTVSKAYISISGQPGKIYQVGDSLPYGVKVYDITADTVILENDGHLEKLPLPRERLQFKPRNTKEHE